MKQQSLIFSDWSVRQILNGTKTQTRRVLKPQPSFHSSGEMTFLPNHDEWHLTPQQGKSFFTKCKFQAGALIWVREVWSLWGFGDNSYPIYRATAHLEPQRNFLGDLGLVQWKSSILMPRQYSRLSLEIVDVRCERLQNISSFDAKSEGVEYFLDGVSNGQSQIKFQHLWDDINGKTNSWASNPFVWVLTFKIHKKGDRHGIL